MQAASENLAPSHPSSRSPGAFRQSLLVVHARHSHRTHRWCSGADTFLAVVLCWSAAWVLQNTSVYMPHIGKSSDEWDKFRTLLCSTARSGPEEERPIHIVMGGFNVSNMHVGGGGGGGDSSARGLARQRLELERAQDLWSWSAENSLHILHPEGTDSILMLRTMLPEAARHWTTAGGHRRSSSNSTNFTSRTILICRPNICKQILFYDHTTRLRRQTGPKDADATGDVVVGNIGRSPHPASSSF